MITVTSKNREEFNEKEMNKRSGKKSEKKDYSDKSPSEKPMAAEGLNSYRYQGRYGHIMIGAKDHEQALREAQRSTRDPVKMEHLEHWHEGEGKYKSVK